MKKTLSIGFIILLMASCAPTVNYVGKSYQPTHTIDIFFSKDDVKRSYEVIGRAEAATPASWGSEMDACQQALEKKAKEKGADAMIIEEVGTGISTSVSDNQVEIQEKKYIKATFIKYQ